MSERTRDGVTDLQLWKGVNQRNQPTLVPEGYVHMAKGALFGYGDNVNRFPGKLCRYSLATPIINLVAFNNIVLIQTLSSLRMVPLSEIVGLWPLDSIADDPFGDFIYDEAAGYIREN